MTETAERITLIVPAAAEAASLEVVTKSVAIDAGLLRDNIGACLSELKQVFARLNEPSIDGWSVGTVSVGLTITAEGSVGIATAGVEATLEITFKPNG